MIRKKLKPYFKTVLAVLWFAFTFSLVTWWWIFSLIQAAGDKQQAGATHRMFAWEGSILLAAILIGGVALIIFSYRDQRRHERLRFFFSTFSHDIKTSIARLRLQAEVLEEDLPNNNNPVMKRLIQDIQRLDLQLENSLLLANLEEDGTILRESVSLSDLLNNLRNEFPDLSLELEKEASIKGDRRALLIVLRNLLQNSVLHGKATSIRIKIQKLGDHKIELCIEDNGLGFKGDLQKLGSEILISTSARGNGIGLLLTKRLMAQMKGDIRFQSKDNLGFQAIVTAEGVL